MDERVRRLKTPEDCERFAKNALDRGRPDLEQEAQRRAVELRAEAHNATNEAEKEALEAVYAYERVLSVRRGKNVRASRTWQMIRRRGILDAVEQVVKRPSETMGFRYLEEMGLKDKAFESVVLRHPELFSEEAVASSRERLAQWEADCDV